MTSLLQRLLALFAAVFLLLQLGLLAAAPARADVQDIAAASRSVVRVALVATDGENAYFVGHGSGVVVAPGKVLTNAHVVELTRTESNIAIGIIPAEGKKSFGGKVIAYSPGNDLALISFDGADLPIATFFAAGPADGQNVTAIGYPGSVDRAQGMSLQDIIHPMSAVRTSGTVSAGRASKQFDTILHTAPLAAGNSGGPLVDECGRILGINSFGSISDGADAEYGFAVSNREIASFLRQAGVQAHRSGEQCRSMADLEAAQQLADERDKAAAEKQASQQAMAQREQAIAAREQAQQDVISKRENMMALAGLLLAIAVGAGVTALLAQSRGDVRRMRLAGGASAALLLAAVILFLFRPGFDSLDGAVSADASSEIANASAGAIAPGVGQNICRLDQSLSRVTVSETEDVPFSWNATGCLNNQTQFVDEQGRWTRILVPANEAAISLRSFDPMIGRYRTDKYLVDAETAGRARALREKVQWAGCTSDPKRLAELARLQSDIRSMLPPQPNERMVYQCSTIGQKNAPAAAGAP